MSSYGLDIPIIIATILERLTCFFDLMNCEVRHRKSP